MAYELTTEGFRAKVGSYEIEMNSGVYVDDVKVKRNGKELFTIAFQTVSHDYKIYPVMKINGEYIELDVLLRGNYPDDDELLTQAMYYNKIYAYVLERIIIEMEYEEKEKL